MAWENDTTQPALVSDPNCPKLPQTHDHNAQRPTQRENTVQITHVQVAYLNSSLFIATEV